MCSRSIEANDGCEAVDWFAELAAAEIVKLGLSGPLFFVPLPNSTSTVKNGKIPRTALLAEAIAGKLKDARVWDGLRWTKEMTPTHQGGTRDPQKLYDHLVVTDPLPKGNLILIDDVFTLGGHVQAAIARLTEKKGVCSLVICAGRTVLGSQNQPFAVVHKPLADFTPA